MLGFAVVFGLWPLAQPGLCHCPRGWAAGHTLRLPPQTHLRCRFASSPTQAETACGDASSSVRQDEQSASLYSVPGAALAAERGFALSASYIWRRAACGSCAGAGPGLSPSSRSWIPGSTRDGRSGAMKEP